MWLTKVGMAMKFFCMHCSAPSMKSYIRHCFSPNCEIRSVDGIQSAFYEGFTNRRDCKYKKFGSIHGVRQGALLKC